MASHCGGASNLQWTQPLSRPCQARASPFGAGVESLVLPSPWRAVAKSGPTQSSCGHTDAGWSCLQPRLAGGGVMRPPPSSGPWPAPGHLKRQRHYGRGVADIPDIVAELGLGGIHTGIGLRCTAMEARRARVIQLAGSGLWPPPQLLAILPSGDSGGCLPYAPLLWSGACSGYWTGSAAISSRMV